MNGLEEDAAQHGTGLAAFVSMLVDESAQTGHRGFQILIQVEICRDFHRHLICLHDQQNALSFAKRMLSTP